MRNGYFLLLLFAACGAIPVEPEPNAEPQMQAPLLPLPENFQGLPLTIVQSATLANTFLDRFYAPPQNVQYFEYENRYITGYILNYGDPLDARLRHRDAMTHLNPDTVERSSSDNHNTHFLLEDLHPHMFFFSDTCAVYFTLDMQQEGFAYDPDHQDNHNLLVLTKAKCEEFKRQFFDAGTLLMHRTHFYVELFFDRTQIPPPYQTVLYAGTEIPFHTTLHYALAEPEQGQIVIETRQHNPEITTAKIIPITKGIGSITYSDTLRPSTSIPEGGTTFSVTATLLPPYTGNETPSAYRSEKRERLPDEQYRTTAFDSIGYAVQ